MYVAHGPASVSSHNNYATCMIVEDLLTFNVLAEEMWQLCSVCRLCLAKSVQTLWYCDKPKHLWLLPIVTSMTVLIVLTIVIIISLIGSCPMTIHSYRQVHYVHNPPYVSVCHINSFVTVHCHDCANSIVVLHCCT